MLSGRPCNANAVNADGSVALGQSNISRNSAVLRAFRSTAGTGINYLGTVLANAGVSMTGISLGTAKGVSGNRQFIVGNETLSGKTRGHLVRDFDQEIVRLTTTVVRPPSTTVAMRNA